VKLCSIEVARYIFNGLLATAVHYVVLMLNVEVFEFSSVGFSNFLASFFGITCSFLGSRYYVFKGHTQAALHQMRKFVLLYGSIALLHGVVLFVWSDLLGFNYQVGFLLATALQVSLSYIGNKLLVFNS